MTSLKNLLLLLTLAATNTYADTTPIPDGNIAKSVGQGITRAWYSCATTRYAHGVLGDAIEGGCLVVTDNDGNTQTLTLSDEFVFEDVTPRIADMNNDGYNDVVTIRSGVQSGAAIAIYSLKDKTLIELAATPPIGRPNRWLAPAGIADFNNDGTLDIAYVQTPHIGGILKVWSIVDSQFKQIGVLPGFSNHSIGSRRVSLSRVLDHNDDGISDLALPDQSRSDIVIVTMTPVLSILDRMPWQAEFFD